jgi:hypothetical protein
VLAAFSKPKPTKLKIVASSLYWVSSTKKAEEARGEVKHRHADWTMG